MNLKGCYKRTIWFVLGVSALLTAFFVVARLIDDAITVLSLPETLILLLAFPGLRHAWERFQRASNTVTPLKVIGWISLSVGAIFAALTATAAMNLDETFLRFRTTAIIVLISGLVSGYPIRPRV